MAEKGDCACALSDPGVGRSASDVRLRMDTLCSCSRFDMEGVREVTAPSSTSAVDMRRLMDILRSSDMFDMEGVGEVGEAGPMSPAAVNVRLLVDMLRSCDKLGMEGGEGAGPSSVDVRLRMDMLHSRDRLDTVGGAAEVASACSPSSSAGSPCPSLFLGLVDIRRKGDMNFFSRSPAVSRGVLTAIPSPSSELQAAAGGSSVAERGESKQAGGGGVTSNNLPNID